MEEPDYEKPLHDLEAQSGDMEDDLEEQRRDTEGVRSDWDAKQGDTGVPGAQEPDALEPRYGGDEEEPEEEPEEDGAEESEDSGPESEDGGSIESRGEGAADVEEEG